MIKRLIIAAILLVLVAGGLVGFNLFRDRAIRQFFANMPVPTVTVSAAEAKAVTWTPHIEAIGTVNAARGVDLTVETAGVVKTIHFEANERVSKGQFLLQLDDAVQRADLEAARAQAALDQQSLERARELQKRGVSTSVTVDTAETTASASQSQVAKLEAVLEQKRLQAPFDGTVGIRRVDVGQYLTPGTVVATMQDLDNMYADFTVPEQQRNSLKIGQPVKLGVSADDMPFSGELIGIDPKVDPATRLVSVRARISNPEGKLTPGQFVRIAVILPQEDGVLALPQTALIASLYGDYVYVVRDPEPKPGEQPGAATAGDEQPAAPKKVVRQAFVNAGRRSAGMVEILSGLEPGDVVVTAGQNRLDNGRPVAIDNTIDPATLSGGKAPAQ